MPSKFLVETALDIGISNLEKTRKTDPKKLYEEVKEALKTETSSEIKDLYGRYIALYESSVASTVRKSGALSDEVKWKHMSDLKKAVEGGIKNLSNQDIEGLNQFALATYARLNSGVESDDATMKLLLEWFRIYQGNNKPAAIESRENESPREAFIRAFYEAYRMPFHYRRKEGPNDILETVNAHGNKLYIGDKEYTFKSKDLDINHISIDKDYVYINTFSQGKKVDIKMTKKEFVEKHLDNILAGKPIILHQKTVDVEVIDRRPQNRPETPRPSDASPSRPAPAPSSVPPVTAPPVARPETSPVVPNSPRKPEKPHDTNKLYDALVTFRNVIAENARKVGRFTPSLESTIEASQNMINQAFANVEKEIRAIDPSKLSKENKALYDSYILEVARYYADEHGVYEGIGTKNRYWKNYDRAMILSAGMLRDDFARWNVQIPPVPTESDIRKKIKQFDPESAAKFEELFKKGYSWGDIISNPKLRGAWDKVRELTIGEYEKNLQQTLKDTNEKYKTGQITFKDDSNGARQKAFQLMVDTMGSDNWYKLSAKNTDLVKDTALVVGSVLGGVVVTAATGGIVTGILAGSAVTTTGMVYAKGRLRDGENGVKDVGFEFLLNGITFGAGSLIAKTGAKLVAGSASNLAKTGVILAEGTGGVALGASIEKTRAWYESIGLSWSEAIKNNFWFAFLPLGLQYKGAFKAESQDIAKRVVNNHQHAEVAGATPAVRAEAEKIAKDAEALSKRVQAEQAKAGPQVKIGENVTENNAPGVKGETAGPTTAPTKTEVAPGKGALENVHVSNDAQFSSWMNALIPKVDKKNFPVGSAIKSGDLEIKAGDHGKYVASYKGKEYNYDSHAELSDGLAKIVKTPEERLALIQSTQSTRILNHMKSFDGVEVAGVPGLRWKHDGDGKISFQKKDSETGSWNKVDAKDLSHEEQLAAIQHWYGVKPQQMKEAVSGLHAKSADDMLSHADKKAITDHHGHAGLEKVKEKINAGKKELLEGWELLKKSPAAILSTITGRGESGIFLHNTSWQKALGWAAVTSLGEAVLVGTPGSWSKETDVTSVENWAEFAAYTALVKFFGPARFLILYGVYMYNKTPSYNAGAQVNRPEQIIAPVGEPQETRQSTPSVQAAPIIQSGDTPSAMPSSTGEKV